MWILVLNGSKRVKFWGLLQTLKLIFDYEHIYMIDFISGLIVVMAHEKHMKAYGYDWSLSVGIRNSSQQSLSVKYQCIRDYEELQC